MSEREDKKTNFYEGGIEYSKYLEEKNNVPEKKSFRDEFTVDDLDPYGNLIWWSSFIILAFAYVWSGYQHGHIHFYF